LKAEFKDLDDAKMERMLAHINIAMNRLVKKYYSEEIEGQFNQLKTTFDEFALSEPPAGGETLNQQLIGTSGELLTVKFVGDPIVEVVEEEAGCEAAADDETKVAANEDGAEAADDAKQDKSDEGKGDEEVAVVKTDADAKQSDADQDDAAEDEDNAEDKAEEQASRCSQCGVPFCQVHCPLHNNIPDWLMLTANGRLEEAYEVSSATNNMPEICGRIGPQDRLCEGNCVIEQSGHGTVTIGSVEKYITEMALGKGLGEARHAINRAG